MRGLSAVVLLCLLAAGCVGTAEEAGPAGVSSAVSTPPSGELTPTDVAFVELAIPQNESALAAAQLTLKRSGSNPSLLALAQQVDSGYRAELERLNGVLTAAGLTRSDQHDGHDMPGMITALELEALDKAQGKAFDDQMGAAFRAHLQESLTVAQSELSAGTAKPVLELGADIERTRTELLGRLGAP
ncbi:DUF305 domain-containing protein [Umezawaea endophytica]|uniref:DUF305 domain-containing protein n=1 Tax=Umezawaea endophytica TaxID=1654476 RepID=A0A9X2VMW3_9PSEU|nr:DUF305 domain-containing protein [Umezawaea endophytica]MCS7479034.1 DUF305 domain-containing protein [Umezawaea endophytica]